MSKDIPTPSIFPTLSGMGTVGDEAIVIILCDMRKNGLLAKVKTITTRANL